MSTAQPMRDGVDDQIVQTEYWYSCKVNAAAANFREKAAAWLRRLAQRIDGRYSLGVEFYSLPPVSEERHLECISAGVVAMNQAVGSEAREEALEGLMKRSFSKLYRDVP